MICQLLNLHKSKMASVKPLAEVMHEAFLGVAKMLSGKKLPLNVRALCSIAEELLLTMWQAAERQSCGSMWLSNLLHPDAVHQSREER